MHDLATALPSPEPAAEPDGEVPRDAQVVSTHVLVPEEQIRQLKHLSRRTRIAQSEYLREAVDDLLDKYGRKPQGGEP